MGIPQSEEGGNTRPLAVVVVTYNSQDVLPGLLDSLPAGLAGTDRCRVVIVDNDSSDGSVATALAHPVHPEVLRTGRNGGYAAGINAAADLVGPEPDLLVLNPDIRLHPGVAATLGACLHTEGAGIVVPQILHEDGEIARSLRREPSLATAWSEAVLGGRLSSRLGTGEIVGSPSAYRRGGPIQWATGAALMIAAPTRARIGRWDESFFLYSEEVDYMRRVRQGGFEIRYVPEAKTTHIGGPYHHNPFLTGLMTRNRIRDYARRHGPVATAAFRLGIAAGAATRSILGPAHRAALVAALTPPVL